MFADNDPDAMFIAVYCSWLAAAIMFSHGSLTRFSRVVHLESRFGHWYYPLPARKHSTLFGIVPPLDLGEVAWHTVCALLVAVLLASAASLASYGGGRNTAFTRPLLASTPVLTVLYFQRVRTHGLVHNKADLVPWVALIMAAGPDGEVCAHVCFLYGCVYLSSGMAKLRATGIKWAHGINLQRMVVQFMLELRQEGGPNFVQRALLSNELVAALAQSTALLFEVLFFPAVVLLAPIMEVVAAQRLLLAFALVGIGFHASVLLSMNIDFVRFWVPGLVALVSRALVKADYFLTVADIYQSSWLSSMVAATFLVAHFRKNSGLQWPASSFDLYNTYYHNDEITYTGLDLLVKRSPGSSRESDMWVPFDLAVCSSSGITRSFGYHHTGMEKRGDVDAFLGNFMPNLLDAEGHKGRFAGVRTVKIVLKFDRSKGRVVQVGATEPTKDVRWVPRWS